MAKREPATQASIYRLKITLRGLRPPIWRRIEVPGNAPLDHLDLMIQAAMGWYNCHLHCFTIGQTIFGMRDDEFDLDFEDETEYRLRDVVGREKERFCYTYDFGDDWEHDVRVEKIMPPEAGVTYPRCTGGARACPPEDVGGSWGYADFLDAIQDPRHEEHESFLEWVGGTFDPEAFDAKKADAAVMALKSLQADMA